MAVTPSRPQEAGRLPVTVLSGFLGAGKTTLLKHILRSAGQAPGGPQRLAVIVNDMGEVNLDALEIRHARLLQEEASMVELHNGCICCTLRGDLLRTVKALCEEGGFDYLVIESTGISEPMPVAQTFVTDVAGESLASVARLDTMVTVVDALSVYEVLASLDTLSERNITGMAGNTGLLGSEEEEEPEGLDDRSIVQLLLEQLEFADVLLLSKVHLLEGGAEAVREIEVLLRKLNPGARLLAPAEPHFAGLPLGAVVNTGLFDMERAQVSAGWFQELATEGGHRPETEEYGVSSVLFREAGRPFHPGRLKALVDDFGTLAMLAEGQGSARQGTFAGVVRAKGQLWVASAHAHPVDFQAAGRHMHLVPSEQPYLAALPQWGEEERRRQEGLQAEGKWSAEHGDRESEAIFIGVDLDRENILAELAAALLTDAEMAGGPASWRAIEDELFGGDYFDA